MSSPSDAVAPPGLERDFPLARLSTVRTGGSAQLFARAPSEAALAALLAWARRAEEPVSVVGSGSNVLIADDGVAGLVLKLLAAGEGDGGGPTPVGPRPALDADAT